MENWNKIIETMKKEAEFDSHISKTSIGKLEKERDLLIQKGKEEAYEFLKDETVEEWNDSLKQTRLQTLEEVEKVINEIREHEYWFRFENEGSDYTEACDDILQQLNKLKYERHN